LTAGIRGNLIGFITVQSESQSVIIISFLLKYIATIYKKQHRQLLVTIPSRPFYRLRGQIQNFGLRLTISFLKNGRHNKKNKITKRKCGYMPEKVVKRKKYRKLPPLREDLRNGIDYDLLYEEWLESGLSRSDFLQKVGLAVHNPVVKEMTGCWFKRSKQASDNSKTAGKLARYRPPPQKEIAEMWQLVQGWRKGLAGKDWRLGENLRRHLDAILRQALGQNEEGYTTTNLSAAALSKIADCAIKIQKIQRLALGMSTENVGLPSLPEPETHVEDKSEPGTPVYVVEVSKAGKFVRSKPRQVQ